MKNIKEIYKPKEIEKNNEHVHGPRPTQYDVIRYNNASTSIDHSGHPTYQTLLDAEKKYHETKKRKVDDSQENKSSSSKTKDITSKETTENKKPWEVTHDDDESDIWAKKDMLDKEIMNNSSIIHEKITKLESATQTQEHQNTQSIKDLIDTAKSSLLDAERELSRFQENNSKKREQAMGDIEGNRKKEIANKTEAKKQLIYQKEIEICPEVEDALRRGVQRDDQGGYRWRGVEDRYRGRRIAFEIQEIKQTLQSLDQTLIDQTKAARRNFLTKLDNLDQELNNAQITPEDFTRKKNDIHLEHNNERTRAYSNYDEDYRNAKTALDAAQFDEDGLDEYSKEKHKELHEEINKLRERFTAESNQIQKEYAKGELDAASKLYNTQKLIINNLQRGF